MIRVDDEFMTEVGLVEMPEAEKQAFMEYAEEELEVRVGQELSLGLTDQQLEDFGAIVDETEAARWLEENAPNYREIAEKVFKELKTEVMQNRAEIAA